jgi:predicted histidine transporter YuiF (NhaC family)
MADTTIHAVTGARRRKQESEAEELIRNGLLVFANNVAEYRKEREAVKEEAEEMERASEAHLRHHTILSASITLFQIGIAVGAISVLTNRKSFWFGSLGFGVAGVVLLILGVVAG